jgi:tRNA A37 threonylcarbamoyladenosine synthetase subunit TsaC/SUA5/YrdC
VRVPASSVARELARLVGRPLFATSANLADQPPAMAFEDLDMALLRGVDLVLDGGPLPFSLPSTVVDVTGPHPRVLRSGAVGTEALTDALGQAAREPQRS